VNALRNIHEALIVGGLLIDTQPVSPQPPVESDSSEIGRLDMSEWARTIDEIDGLIQQTIRDSLFALVDQRNLTVTDQFDTGRELIEEATEWAGTRINPVLAERIAEQPQPVRVHQEVRLRVLKTQSLNLPTPKSSRRGETCS
jgi:hypothetical protein